MSSRIEFDFPDDTALPTIPIILSRTDRSIGRRFTAVTPGKSTLTKSPEFNTIRHSLLLETKKLHIATKN